MEEQEEILDPSIKPGTILGRIPGETNWYAVEEYNKEFHTHLEQMQIIEKDRKNLGKEEFNARHNNYIKKIKTEYINKNKNNYNNRNKIRRYFDLKYKINKDIRSKMGKCIRNKKDSTQSKYLLGCSIEELFSHLKKQFTDGMSFANYGKWVIDHKIPLNSYNPFNPIEQQKSWNWRNLQPLWHRDNACKHAKHKLEDKQKYDNSFIYEDGKLIFNDKT